MRILGVDFTSVPGKGKAITVADCTLSDGTLRFKTLTRIESFSEFDQFLKAPGPWIAGFDFPFGQSRRFLENTGWSSGVWADYIRRVAKMDKPKFRNFLEDYKRLRPYGDKEHSRRFEKAIGAASPQKLYGVPVAKMFFEGAPRLLCAGLHLPLLADGDKTRIGVEAYPGVAARALVGKPVAIRRVFRCGGAGPRWQPLPYKSDKGRKQTGALLAARRSILAALTGEKGREIYALDVGVPDWLATDPTGDHLDAVLCAVQAAWAQRTVLAQPVCLSGFDPLEGWIADPEVFRNLSSISHPQHHNP